jgi:hypothetical protein
MDFIPQLFGKRPEIRADLAGRGFSFGFRKFRVQLKLRFASLVRLDAHDHHISGAVPRDKNRLSGGLAVIGDFIGIVS